MTYLHFHAVFIVPVLAVLAFVRWKGAPTRLPRPTWSAAILCLLALGYTAPWDNYLVARGVWTYREERILAAWKLGYVPLEEYIFFVLQTILTALIFFHFASRAPAEASRITAPAGGAFRPGTIGALSMLLLTVAGGAAIFSGGRWLYFGLISAWAGPVLALHWAIGGRSLWAARRLITRAVSFATVYLWIVDAIAIDWEIWAISPHYSLGVTILGLPLEEAWFFLLTNLLVVQGLVLCAHFLPRSKGEG